MANILCLHCSASAHKYEHSSQMWYFWYRVVKADMTIEQPDDLFNHDSTGMNCTPAMPESIVALGQGNRQILWIFARIETLAKLHIFLVRRHKRIEYVNIGELCHLKSQGLANPDLHRDIDSFISERWWLKLFSFLYLILSPFVVCIGQRSPNLI